MINYALTIKNLAVTNQHAGKTNYVSQIIVEVEAFDDESNITGTVQSMMGLPFTESNSFIEYADLTEETVLSWIGQDDPRLENAKALAVQQIERKKIPTIISPVDRVLSPPWIPPVVYETSSSNTSTVLGSTSTNVQMWQTVAFEQNMARVLIKFGLLTEDPTTIPVSTP